VSSLGSLPRWSSFPPSLVRALSFSHISDRISRLGLGRRGVGAGGFIFASYFGDEALNSRSRVRVVASRPLSFPGKDERSTVSEGLEMDKNPDQTPSDFRLSFQLLLLSSSRRRRLGGDRSLAKLFWAKTRIGSSSSQENLTLLIYIPVCLRLPSEEEPQDWRRD